MGTRSADVGKDPSWASKTSAVVEMVDNRAHWDGQQLLDASARIASAAQAESVPNAPSEGLRCVRKTLD